MISKLEELKAFLRKEGGGGGNGGGGGGDGGGDGGGFSGTVSTVDSSGFVPTYGGGGKKKKPDKTKVTKGSESFAKELLDFAIEESEQLNKAKDMRNTALGQSSPSGDNSKYTRHADIGRNSQHRVLSPPEVPLQHDAVLNWEELFQKSEMVDLQITAKVLIRDSAGQLLILKDRSSDWWDLPGGHIHEDETPEEGALREVQEETGLKLNDAFLVMGAEVDTDTGHKLALFLVSSIPVESPKPLISEEHTDFAWVRLEDSRYYNLGVWAPIVEYMMGDSQDTDPESLENLQSEVLDSFNKAVVIHTEDNGDKTILTADGVYLVKSNGSLFKQEPSEETSNLPKIEEDDFLENQTMLIPEGKESDFHWAIEKFKINPIPTEFYKPPSKDHQDVINRPFKILSGTPENYTVASPHSPNSSKALDELEQLQITFRSFSDGGKARLEEVVNKSDTTLLKLFGEYGREHGLRIDRYESLLEDILSDVNTIVMDKKYKINYPRPWQYEMEEPYFIYDIANAIRPSIDTPSYPSGHSTQALVIAEILGNMYPNHLENFREIADDIGINRVKAGWHFPMDHTAGKKLALEIVDTLPDSLELEKDRVYLKPGEVSPEGVRVETGPAGGRFYDAEVSPGTTELAPTEKPAHQLPEAFGGPKDEPVHPDREPGSTTEWESLTSNSLDSKGLDATGRTMKALDMSWGEWDRKFRPQWVSGSDDEKYGEAWHSQSLAGHSITLQYAAAHLFSSDKVRVDKMSKHFKPVNIGTLSSPEHLTDDEIHSDTAKQAATEYLRDAYANTQRSFEERGIKELKLYRGIDTAGQVGVKPGQRVGMKDLPLSSWSANPDTAKSFGDTVVSRTFDPQDIVMSMMDKLPSSEFEFMVHTPDQGFESTVQSVSYTDQR